MSLLAPKCSMLARPREQLILGHARFREGGRPRARRRLGAGTYLEKGLIPASIRLSATGASEQWTKGQPAAIQVFLGRAAGSGSARHKQPRRVSLKM
jgi:hypothetical protein